MSVVKILKAIAFQIPLKALHFDFPDTGNTIIDEHGAVRGKINQKQGNKATCEIKQVHMFISKYFHDP
jgi:hypothetical protein